MFLLVIATLDMVAFDVEFSFRNAVWQRWRKTVWRHRTLVPVLYAWDDLVHPLGSQETPPGWPISSFTKLSYDTGP